jgi:hypothetical protein
MNRFSTAMILFATNAVALKMRAHNAQDATLDASVTGPTHHATLDASATAGPKSSVTGIMSAVSGKLNAAVDAAKDAAKTKAKAKEEDAPVVFDGTFGLGYLEAMTGMTPAAIEASVTEAEAAAFTLAAGMTPAAIEASVTEAEAAAFTLAAGMTPAAVEASVNEAEATKDTKAEVVPLTEDELTAFFKAEADKIKEAAIATAAVDTTTAAEATKAEAEAAKITEAAIATAADDTTTASVSEDPVETFEIEAEAGASDAVLDAEITTDAELDAELDALYDEEFAAGA